MFTMSLVRSAALVLVTAGLVACTEEAEDAGTEETGAAITISAVIESGTAVVGQNALVVTLVDNEGSPLVGAAVTVDPQMPSMGHGSREVAVVTDNGDGTATLVLDYNVQ
jgi:hypothetical protein